MKNLLGNALVLLLGSFFILSCDPTEPVPIPEANNGQIHLSMRAKWNNEPYNNAAIVVDENENRIRIENFMSYISSISLLKPDGSTILLKDYYLADFSNSISFDFTVPKGDYSGISFLLGVPAAVNTDTDPAQYPNSHPLSVPGSQGMFWNWNTGYIFTKLDGRADTTGTEGTELLFPISYHTGDDFYSRHVNFEDYNFILGASETKNITLTLALDKIFFPVNGNDIIIEDESSSHSPGPLALKFVGNFAHAFSIE